MMNKFEHIAEMSTYNNNWYRINITLLSLFKLISTEEEITSYELSSQQNLYIEEKCDEFMNIYSYEIFVKQEKNYILIERFDIEHQSLIDIINNKTKESEKE